MQLLRGVTTALALASTSIGLSVGLASCSGDQTETTHQAQVVVSTDLVISQVYGGGGNSMAPYKNDFIEVFNRGSSPVQLQGYSLQYASASGDFTTSMNFYYDFGNFSLQPGQYFLLQCASGGGNGNALPAADGMSAIALGAAAGKVALVLTNNKFNNCGGNDGGCPNNWIDLVGYGSGVTQYEGSGSTAATSNTTAALRKSNGCTETDDNKNDFSVAAPNPRNSQSSTNNCNADAGSDSGSDADPDAAQDGGAQDGGSDSGSSDSGSDGGTSDSGADAGPVTVGKLVISQVYGGGGNSMATYANDYVEIFNRDSMPLSTNGYSLQYASATGTFSNVSNTFDLPALTLAPGQYFLVQLASGGATGMALPTPDATGGLNLGATNGKVALTLTSKKLNGCGTMASPCMNGDWIDLVGFGSADFYEGAGAGPALSNTKAGFRAGDGCIDTDVNSADISANNPAPRNSASALNKCTPSTDGGTMTDSGVADSGGGKDGSTTDATVSTDGSMDGSKSADGGDMMDSGGGCGCSQAGPPDSASALGGLAFAALLTRSLRRRKKQ